MSKSTSKPTSNSVSKPVLVTHGGAGGPRENSDACERAGDAGLRALAEGGNALSAAVAATVVLEDDPRLNAGTGSNLRLDGETIEMDAAVMTGDARFGAVAAIQRVRNPVEVARAVLDTPHLLLAGEGATRFARAPAAYPTTTPSPSVRRSDMPRCRRSSAASPGR